MRTFPTQKSFRYFAINLTSSAVQPLRLREVEVRPADWAGAKAAAEVARRAAMASLYMMDELMALTRETTNEKWLMDGVV